MGHYSAHGENMLDDRRAVLARMSSPDPRCKGGLLACARTQRRCEQTMERRRLKKQQRKAK